MHIQIGDGLPDLSRLGGGGATGLEGMVAQQAMEDMPKVERLMRINPALGIETVLTVWLTVGRDEARAEAALRSMMS